MPRIFLTLAVALVISMAWANHRGYMISNLFGAGSTAERTAPGGVNHK